ncbi:MAG: hypothetical protein ACTHLT_08720 [Devosia sp.]
MDTSRIDIIASALARAARQQGVLRVDDLDFEQLALAVEALTGSEPAVAVSPLDPEGDGLTPKELNAANDG